MNSQRNKFGCENADKNMPIIVKVLILELKLTCRRWKRHPKGDSNKSAERMKEFSNWAISQ